jgi:predicted nucleotidyltransferase component of viral defense system
MEKTLLTGSQIAALDEFKKNQTLSSLFYLSGGTALTEFYLKHRYSDDLDFFTTNEFSAIEVEKFINNLKIKLNAEFVSYKKLYDRRIFIFHFKDELDLKVEFSLYPFKQINLPQNLKGLLVDSLEDIATNKLMSIIDRNEPKDFFDLYFLLKGKFKLILLVENVNKKFGFKIDLLTLGSELAKIKYLDFRIIRSIINIDDKDIKIFFEKQVASLKEYILE